MEKLGLKLAPIWDTILAGGIYLTTPQHWLLNNNFLSSCYVIICQSYVTAVTFTIVVQHSLLQPVPTACPLLRLRTTLVANDAEMTPHGL